MFVASKSLSGPAELDDLVIDGLKHMDAMGIDVQFLSYITPGTQFLSATEAMLLARDANDRVESAIAAYPDRFAGFATLPTWTRGAMINGRTQDRFLDDPQFNPILKMAEALDVQLYLHPTIPSKAL